MCVTNPCIPSHINFLYLTSIFSYSKQTPRANKQVLTHLTHISLEQQENTLKMDEVPYANENGLLQGLACIKSLFCCVSLHGRHGCHLRHKLFKFKSSISMLH